MTPHKTCNATAPCNGDLLCAPNGPNQYFAVQQDDGKYQVGTADINPSSTFSIKITLPSPDEIFLYSIVIGYVLGVAPKLLLTLVATPPQIEGAMLIVVK